MTLFMDTVHMEFPILGFRSGGTQNEKNKIKMTPGNWAVTMGFNVFFYSIYFDRYLRLGQDLDIVMWLFLGDALLAF